MSTDPRDLVGHWRLTRRLSDRRIGAGGTFVGTLALGEDGTGQLRWRESGLLSWGGRHVTAEREYLLRRRADGWWVHFADGRPFHAWKPNSTVEHLCVADTYRGLVRIDSPAAWRVGWHVTGPRKDQRIVTRLTAPDPAASRAADESTCKPETCGPVAQGPCLLGCGRVRNSSWPSLGREVETVGPWWHRLGHGRTDTRAAARACRA